MLSSRPASSSIAFILTMEVRKALKTSPEFKYNLELPITSVTTAAYHCMDL